MDPRVELLRAFSRGFTVGAAKVETARHGLRFLDELLSSGGRLEYGELTPLRLVHRYKVVDIPDDRMDDLMRAHVDKELNVCRYFNPAANDTFCFNLDNNHRTHSGVVIPEMELAIRALWQCLCELGCPPLIVASGRGFHVWCRLTESVDNDRLYRFMLPAAAVALASVHAAGYDHRNVKVNLYPHVQLQNAVSLRLFGSNHAKTGVFSHIWTVDGLLGEGASWDCFEEFVRNPKVSPDAIDAARTTLVGGVDLTRAADAARATRQCRGRFASSFESDALRPCGVGNGSWHGGR
jgi:hypothetical protein